MLIQKYKVLNKNYSYVLVQCKQILDLLLLGWQTNLKQLPYNFFRCGSVGRANRNDHDLTQLKSCRNSQQNVCRWRVAIHSKWRRFPWELCCSWVHSGRSVCPLHTVILELARARIRIPLCCLTVCVTFYFTSFLFFIITVFYFFYFTTSAFHCRPMCDVSVTVAGQEANKDRHIY